MKRRMIQCTTTVNRDAVRRESIGGIEHVIVSSFTLPDNVVMNGILYPAEEIEAGFPTLERTLAPVEHPTDSQGNFISASDPEAIHNFHAGAFNVNVSRENNRVHIEKFINVQEALKTDRGRRLLDRINELETSEDPRPIHTSVGVFIDIEETDGVQTNADGDEFTMIARGMLFDHDAILLDSVGAAQPGQGVGMAVNRSGQECQVDHFIIPNTITASTSLPLAATDRVWDAAAADKRVRESIGAEDAPNAIYGTYHLWFDGGEAENFGAYKLPFVDIVDGERMAIPAALRNAAARLDQTDGPTDAEKTRIRNIIDGYLEQLRTNQQSLSDLHRAVFEALEKGGFNVHWIEELFTDEVVFSSNGDDLFTVPFTLDETTGIVTIVGVPLPVERNVTFTPKVNSEEGDAMKDLMLKALAAAGITVNADISDVDLLAQYTQLQANQSEGDGAGAGNDDAATLADVVASALKPVTDELAGLKAQMNKQTDKEHADLAGVVANSGKFPGLDEESALLLPVEKLKAMAANCGTAHGIPLAVNNFGGDTGASQIKTVMPE